MNTENMIQQPSLQQDAQPNNQQLLNKLLELEQRLILIEKKLTTPLITG
jgi:hypothetical protein